MLFRVFKFPVYFPCFRARDTVFPPRSHWLTSVCNLSHAHARGQEKIPRGFVLGVLDQETYCGDSIGHRGQKRSLVSHISLSCIKCDIYLEINISLVEKHANPRTS